MAVFNLKSGNLKQITLDEKYIDMAYMAYLFEEINEMRVLNDPQSIGFSNKKNIKIIRRFDTLYIIFTDDMALEISVEELKDFHYILETYRRRGLKRGQNLILEDKGYEIFVGEEVPIEEKTTT